MLWELGPLLHSWVASCWLDPWGLQAPDEFLGVPHKILGTKTAIVPLVWGSCACCYCTCFLFHSRQPSAAGERQLKKAKRKQMIRSVAGTRGSVLYSVPSGCHSSHRQSQKETSLNDGQGGLWEILGLPQILSNIAYNFWTLDEILSRGL